MTCIVNLFLDLSERILFTRSPLAIENGYEGEITRLDKKDDKPKVSLMSIHQSKGLEYPECNL